MSNLKPSTQALIRTGRSNRRAGIKPEYRKIMADAKRRLRNKYKKV